MTVFLLDDDHDPSRDSYAVIFSDTPYKVLSDAKFDVGNFEINDIVGLNRMSSCVSFSIIQELNDEFRKAFSKWYEHVFEHNNDLHNEYEATAFLLRHDEEGRLLRKYALDRVFPTGISFGHSMRGKSLAEITITSYFNRIIDDANDNEMSNAVSTQDAKEAEQELKIEEQNKEMQKKNEEKSTAVLDEVKPLVQMMNKLDELRDTIDNDSQLYSCEFIEAIYDYNELLGYRCLEIVRDACKDK